MVTFSRANRTKSLLAMSVAGATAATGLVAAQTAVAPPAAAAKVETRSVYTWPFARTSIWNMPIGKGARYRKAKLRPANAWYGRITVDPELISVSPGAPVKRLRAAGQPGHGARVRVQSNLAHNGSWNGCATFLSAGSAKVWQGQPLTLRKGGSPTWTWTTTRTAVSLKGQGVAGCHGGSHMSGIGGSIRMGELKGSRAIRHALKVNLYAKKYLYRGSSARTSYRWPALSADSCWSSCYGGTNTALKMGALLALPPRTDLSFVTDRKARKIAVALRDYGAYVVDDTAWDVHAIAMDRRVLTSGQWPTANKRFHAQLQKVFTKLAVVANNKPSSKGGPGARRAPLAPCFAKDRACIARAQRR